MQWTVGQYGWPRDRRPRVAWSCASFSLQPRPRHTTTRACSTTAKCLRTGGAIVTGYGCLEKPGEAEEPGSRPGLLLTSGDMTGSNSIANQFSSIVRQVTKWQQAFVGHRHRDTGHRVQRVQQVAVTCVLVFCLVMLLYYNSGSPRSDPQRAALHQVQAQRDANSEASESGQSPRLCENLRKLQVRAKCGDSASQSSAAAASGHC